MMATTGRHYTRRRAESNSRVMIMMMTVTTVAASMLALLLCPNIVVAAEAFATSNSASSLRQNIHPTLHMLQQHPFTSPTNGRAKQRGGRALVATSSTSHNDINDGSNIHKIRGGGGDASSDKTDKQVLFREMIAELIGTFIIVQIGTGSVMSAVYTNSLMGLFQIASVWIIAVTIAITTTASISGAHLNPAISIAFAWLRPSKNFNWNKVLPYSVAQLIGAILGSWTNLCLYASSIQKYEQANNIIRASSTGIASAKAFGEYFVSPISTGTAFLAEAVGTGVLAFVIFALTNPKNETTNGKGNGGLLIPPLIGTTVGALIAVLAPLTQAGFNPARDFGPRIVAYLAGWKAVAFQGWWVYVLGPIVGAIFGATIADKVLYK